MKNNFVLAILIFTIFFLCVLGEKLILGKISGWGMGFATALAMLSLIKYKKSK